MTKDTMYWIIGSAFGAAITITITTLNIVKRIREEREKEEEKKLMNQVDDIFKRSMDEMSKNA